MLSIWPDHHEYAQKELGFTVFANNSGIGDLNADGLVNILDVVIYVNIILSI